MQIDALVNTKTPLATASSPGQLAPSPSLIGPLPRSLAKPPGTTSEVYWMYATGFIGLHLLAPLALIPWLFSWTGVALVFLGNYAFGTLGINLGYHRILTHRGLVVPKWLEHTLVVLGVCCLQDAPVRWVAIHRMHHQFSDDERDPHSPLVDFLWSHLGWLVYRNVQFGTSAFYERYARDVAQDRFYYRLQRRTRWLRVYIAHALLMFAVAALLGAAISWDWLAGLQFGLSILVWGVFVRTVYVWHITWAVNSVTHRWGYRNYETDDESRNNWLIALATNGEGWHNNHHAHPRCAAHGHRWWELDLTYWTIVLLEKMGLAKNVVRPEGGERHHEAGEKQVAQPDGTPTAARHGTSLIV